MVIVTVIVLKLINNGGRLLEIKCAMIAHFIFCPIKTHPKSILEKVEKLGLVKVPSRFMRKIVCRLRLNEVSRQ